MRESTKPAIRSGAAEVPFKPGRGLTVLLAHIPPKEYPCVELGMCGQAHLLKGCRVIKRGAGGCDVPDHAVGIPAIGLAWMPAPC